jgi:hypothetical protein
MPTKQWYWQNPPAQDIEICVPPGHIQRPQAPRGHPGCFIGALAPPRLLGRVVVPLGCFVWYIFLFREATRVVWPIRAAHSVRGLYNDVLVAA